MNNLNDLKKHYDKKGWVVYKKLFSVDQINLINSIIDDFLNKKIKYSLGKMYGYNNAGKYQLKNQYTLKYGNFYFKYNTEEEKIEFYILNEELFFLLKKVRKS